MHPGALSVWLERQRTVHEDNKTLVWVDMPRPYTLPGAYRSATNSATSGRSSSGKTKPRPLPSEQCPLAITIRLINSAANNP